MGEPAIAIDLYGFDDEFERAILTLCCTRPRFWGRVGYLLEADAFQDPLAKLLLPACSGIARESGHGPGSTILVIARLRRAHGEGKVTLTDVRKCVDLFDAADDRGLPEEDAAVNEIAPLLKRRGMARAVLAAHDGYARKTDMRAVVDIISKSARIGEADTSTGTRVGSKGFGPINNQGTTPRLSTGILELDLGLNGGLLRKGLGFYVGSSGDGKSMALVGQVAEGLRARLHVVFATLELPKPIQLARLYANLTGIPTDNILAGGADNIESQRRMEVVEAGLGTCSVREFEPYATTVNDIRDWVVQCGDEVGRPVDLVVIDYADKLFDPKVRADNSYLAMGLVYEGLRRDIAVALDCWVWTASQAKALTKDAAKKFGGGHQAADSMNKTRVADLQIDLHANDTGNEMAYFVAKNRHGVGRFNVGPLPTEFARGRITPLTSELGAW